MIPKLVSVASVLLLASLSLDAYGAPTDDLPPRGLKIPLRARSTTNGLGSTDLELAAKRQRDAVIAKYSTQPSRKRSTGYNLIVDQSSDSSYFGSLAVGTPLTSFDVILDTGSSDLWLVGESCDACGTGIPPFNPSSSSSFRNLSTPFFIQYGQGQAGGYLGQDTVEMAGLTVSDQVFAVVNELASGVLSSPVSGLIGLAWESIAVSGRPPFWQTLASSGTLDSALFAVQLRRYSNDTRAATLEPGGEITFGYTNSSLFTGSIDYVDVSGTPSYWLLDLASLTVQGNSVSLGSQTGAAIDTGTTNVGGPTSVIRAIYDQIPGSSAGTGSWEGYYYYPCNTTVTVELSFGSQTWTMNPVDFLFAPLNSDQCIGAFFDAGTTSDGSSDGTPAWIIGDAFLKNVYSVFRYSPPSVGFAALSAAAVAQNGVDGTAPTPTIGTSTASVTSGSGSSSNGATTVMRRGVGGVGTAALAVTMALLVL